MSYYSRGYGWGGFAPYVTMAERQAKAARTAERLAKKLKRALQPVALAGRTIAKTFWGKAWCDNIESYRDYAYRLERGRSYVRSGAVIDLDIAKGRVTALVVGSGRNPYNVTISIARMPTSKWEALVTRMTGKISSLMALAAGKLPKELLEDFCNAETGLFPKPNEIKLSCDCPDGAVCCKHVAAVLYGIGARLDAAPELFFTLRGVDAASIVSAEAVVDSLTGEAASEIASDDLGSVFGIELDASADAAPPEPLVEAPKKRTAKKPPKTISPRTGGPRAVAAADASERVPPAVAAADASERVPPAVARTPPEPAPRKKAPIVEPLPTGNDLASRVKRLRLALGLTQGAFGARLGTYQAVISNVERGVATFNAGLLKKFADLERANP